MLSLRRFFITQNEESKKQKKSNYKNMLNKNNFQTDQENKQTNKQTKSEKTRLENRNLESLKSGKYLIIDTETGGLDPKTGLIQVGAIVLDESFQPIDTFVCVIKPPKNQPISKFSQKITNLDTKKINSGLTYKKFCKSFLSFLQKNFDSRAAICVGHFFPFDYARIMSVFSHSKMFDQVCKYITNVYIDTKVLALYQNLKAQKENKKLPFPVLSLSNPGGLKETLNLDFESHDALGDCWGTYHVLIKLLEDF